MLRAIVVFACSPLVAVAAPQFKTLYAFSGGTDGGSPGAPLVAGPGGSFFGTTEAGGAGQNGTVFQLSPGAHGTWTERTLYSFGGGLDGAVPFNMFAGPDGDLYGVTMAGGGAVACTHSGTVVGCGTVFRLSPPASGQSGWTETILYTFQGTTDGLNPTGIARDAAGMLYGFTFGGTGTCHFQTASFPCGTAFALSPPSGGGAWRFRLLYTWRNDADGDGPWGPPLLGADGALYGETSHGGPGGQPAACAPADGCGGVFALTPPSGGEGAWTKQTLHQFNGFDGTGGSNPLVWDRSGSLLGMTNEGGPPNPACPEYTNFGAPAGCGVAFRLSPPRHAYRPWIYQTIWDFTLGGDSGYPYNTALTCGGSACYAAASGPYPIAPSYGAVVSFTPGYNPHVPWAERTLWTFTNGADEAQPAATLVRRGGVLFGTAQGYGTTGSWGTVFRVKP